jgi:glycogen synthase
VHGFEYIEFADYFAEGAFVLHARRRERGRERLCGAVLGVRLHTPSEECWAINGERVLPAESAAMGPLEYRVMSAADVLISPSEALLGRVRDGLAARGLRRPPGRVVVYPFDVGAFEAGEVDDARDEVRPTVLCFGRLERRKGVDVLVRAAVEMLEGGSCARFVFVGGDTRTGPGQGSMREHMETLVPGRWRGRVVMEGAMERDAVLGLVGSATVCCFPAIWDNFPNALLEAMAMGRAIVATGGSGMGEIIEDGVSGVLVGPSEVGALARAIERVLGDASLRGRIGRGARVRVQGLCDPARVIGEMEVVIGGVNPSMRRDFRRWRELSPAVESMSVVARGRRVCAKLLAHDD